MPTPPDSPAASAWICIQAETKREHIAAAHLATIAAVEDVFCPRIRFPKATRRGKVWFVEAFFPGYVFAKCRLEEVVKQVVLTRAVRRIVRFGDYVHVVQETIIEQLRASCPAHAGDTLHIEPDLQPGDSIQIAGGAFTGSAAIVLATLPGTERVRILIDFLGRRIETDADLGTLVPDLPYRPTLAGG